MSNPFLPPPFGTSQYNTHRPSGSNTEHPDNRSQNKDYRPVQPPPSRSINKQPPIGLLPPVQYRSSDQFYNLHVEQNTRPRTGFFPHTGHQSSSQLYAAELEGASQPAVKFASPIHSAGLAAAGNISTFHHVMNRQPTNENFFISNNALLRPAEIPEDELYRQHAHGLLMPIIIPNIKNPAEYQEFLNSRPANIVFNVKINEKTRVRGRYPTVLVDETRRLYYPDFGDFEHFVADGLLGRFAIGCRTDIKGLKVVAKKEGRVLYSVAFGCSGDNWCRVVAELVRLGVGARKGEGINMAHTVSLLVFLH